MRSFDNFDEFAEKYRNIHNKSIKLSGADSDYFSRYKIEELLKNEESNQNLDVLDFGCGDGNSVKYMINLFKNWRIKGIDISEESINKASQSEMRNASFNFFDGINIPYESDTFDLVFTSMVFHHINHELHDRVLNEIHRVLKPNGRFYIFEHNPLNPVTRKVVRECPFDKDAELLNPSYTKSILVRNKFKNEKIKYTIFFPRHNIFKPFLFLENLFKKLPLGAQYYYRSNK